MTSTTDTPPALAAASAFIASAASASPGEPKGKMETIHGLNTYVATPANPSSDSASKAIIYFYDAFGLKLANNKLIPDKLADATGLTVYVPDVFNGGGISEESISAAPSTAADFKAASILTKLKVGAAFALAAPFFARNVPHFKIPTLKTWIDNLKASHNYTRLGGTGFCYGGKFVIALNATGHIDVSVASHPSMITKGDMAAIKNPILFNCAEEDPMFTQAYAKEVEKQWAEAGGKPVHKFQYYPNTIHGFAVRPNLADKQVKEAFEKALSETVSFWKAHL